MAEPILNAASVVAGVGEGVAAGMREHMAWTGKAKRARAPMRLISRLTASSEQTSANAGSRNSASCHRSVRL
jgi:hypothetical protein